MGKTKKTNNNEKEEGQKKIFSFFQKADEKKTQKSALFWEVGKSVPSTVINPHHTTCKTEDKVIVLSDSEEFVDPQNKSRSSKEIKQKSKNTLQNDLKVLSESDKNTRIRRLESVISDPVIIPETQFEFTPETKVSGKSTKENKVDRFMSPVTLQDESLDCSLIPNTPEDLKVQSKRPFSRSYLLSSTEFASNPIQKAKEHREAKHALKRKQMSAARKSLVSVSVNFNDKQTHDIIKTVEVAKPDDSQSNQPDGRTPTKISENGFSLKRMAKSGVSPDPKRNSVSGETENNTGSMFDEIGNMNYTVMKTLDFEVNKTVDTDKTEDVIREQEIRDMNQKAVRINEKLEQKKKEKLEKLEKEKEDRLQKQKQMKKEQRKKNGMKLINYQLHGDTYVPKREDKSVKNDDVLDNLLDELNNPKPSDNPIVKTTKLHTDMEKDNTRQLDVKKDNKQPVRKRYSLENVLKFGHDANKDQKADSSNKKASDLFEKLSTEWTAEDEALMKELDMTTDIKTVCNSDTRDMKSDMKTVCNTGNTCDTRDLQVCGINTNIPYYYKKDSNQKTGVEIVNEEDFSSTSDKEMQNAEDETDHETKILHEKHETKNKLAETTRVSDIKTAVPLDKRFISYDNLNSTDTPEQMFVESTPAKPCSAGKEMEDDIDEFMTQFDSDMICDQIEHFTPFKDSRYSKKANPVQTQPPCVKYGRHIVTQVEQKSDKIILDVLSQPEELNVKCFLHGNWQDTHVNPGDIVHILSELKNNEYHITDQSGFIVVNPDLLLSGTTVVGSVFCMRRSILKEKFKGCEKGNIQMLYGSILHSVFQEVLRKELVDDQILEEAAKIVKQNVNLLEIYSNDTTEEKVMEEVKNYLPQIKSWTKQFTNIGKATSKPRTTDLEVLVSKVNDIEENIWSPRLGIKGKIDLTVDVLQKGNNRVSTLPLELKTGRPSYSVEHKGQVTLYSMMSSDRRKDPGRGLLLYLKEPSMKVIPADPSSQAGLIQLRNEMAFYISRQVVKTTSETGPTYTLGTLPRPISNTRACEKCPQLVNCAIYQRDVEGRPVSTDSMGRLVQESIGHLTSVHIDYYTHWCLMLDLETQTDRAKQTLADIWCLSASDREKIGACFSCMVVQSTNFVEGDCTVSFSRRQNNSRTTPLSSIGPVVTDSVVISCESLSWVAVCTGFIKHISDTDLHILIDREGVERLSKLQEETFRIDLCNNFSTAGIFYTNVSRLMSNEHRFEILRSLIIEKRRPEFQNTLSKTNIEKVKGIFKTLNKPQKTAVLKVLMSKHYVLIRGYPGTGKTSTIVAIVKVLNSLGLSVLLTSYTHSAVDNILLKLKKDNVKFLRLGRISKVQPEIQDSCAEILTKNISSVPELQTFFNSQMIVATSCLGTNHPLFSHRMFDVCIIDEASQVLQPACLGPLFSSRKFVLVGDSKQLPPVVQSKEARELGMDESLFVRLDGLGATFGLNLQYRMNSEIMAICNRLIYNNCLKCGTEDIANRTLVIPNKEKVTEIIQASPWLSSILDSHLNKSVVFCNTEHIQAVEFREKGGIIKNQMEADIVKKVVKALLKVGVDSTDIGIIAPYRSQVFLIRNVLRKGQMSYVEVNTVDQYQGRDKSVIIISFVRSTSDTNAKKTGELLNDIRRLNVAVTRAKSKLVMIGNIPVLQQYPPVKEVIEMSHSKQQIVDIPREEVI